MFLLCLYLCGPVGRISGRNVKCVKVDVNVKLQQYFLVIAILAIFSSSLSAQKAGTTTVAKWKDDKDCAFILMFDDNSSTHVKNVIPELSKRGYTGTFYICPGTGHYKVNKKFWEETVVKGGFELANHTLSHKGGATEKAVLLEIDACTEAIRQMTPQMPWPRLLSWGKPGGLKQGMWPIGEKEEYKKMLVEKNLVLRPDFGGRGGNIAFKTGPQMIAHLDKAIKNKAMECIIFHGVGGDWISVSFEAFKELLDGIQKRQDKVWLTQHVAAHQYAVERDSAEVKVTKSSASQISLSLTSKADAKFYYHPLTLKTQVPAGWQKCKVSQGSKAVEVTVKDGSIMYDAVPGAESITITKK